MQSPVHPVFSQDNKKNEIQKSLPIQGKDSSSLAFNAHSSGLLPATRTSQKERFEARQLKNFHETFSAVDTQLIRFTNDIHAFSGLVELFGIPKLALEQDQFNHIHQKGRDFAASLLSLLPRPTPQHVLKDPHKLIKYYADWGVSGRIEAIDDLDNAFLVRGWATTQNKPGSTLLVTLYDDQGCLGIALPCLPRPDVSDQLVDCVQDCGFTTPLTRVPSGSLSAYIQVFRDNTPVMSCALPLHAETAHNGSVRLTDLQKKMRIKKNSFARKWLNRFF